MRPFRFFFLVSIGVIVFFAVAKVVLFALFIAAIMSLIFFGVRTIMNFFSGLRWEHNRGYNDNYLKDRDFDFRKGFSEFNFDTPRKSWENERIIQIR